MNTFQKFKKDRSYLTQYHSRRMMMMAAAVVAVILLKPPSVAMALAALPLILLVGSIHISYVIAGVLVASGFAFFQPEFSAGSAVLMFGLSFVLANVFTGFVHNASHGNIKPRWLNNIVGEICGVVQLVGFSDWTIIHVLHHSNTDHPVLDPHAPGDSKFLPFLLGMRQQILKVVLAFYFKVHGQNPETVKQISDMARFSRAGHLLKVSFWYLLLGPQYFAFLFAPSIVFKMLVLAWLNHSAHRKVDGKNVILNNNSGFYKVVNLFSFNLYFHDNHHINPKLFDPRKMRPSTDEKQYDQAA